MKVWSVIFMSGKQRHFFPGGNTSKGFYSFYRYILSQDEAKRIICIKGGPGTGKSSLMKKVASIFLEKGYEVEYHHCSSDNNSLDGVVIKGLNVALLDGTSPHVVDPINPGAVDEILNLGQCWNEEGFKSFKPFIMDTNKKVGKIFRRAYRFFGAAKDIYEDWSTFNSEALNLNKLSLLKEELKNDILPNSVSKLGFDRHLFATAFTPNGIVTYIENLIEGFPKIYVLKGGPGTGKTNILQYLYEEAVRRGYYVEVFHTPLTPDKIEHVLIPALGVAVVTSNEINNLNINGKIYDMNNLLNKNLLEKNKDDIDEVKETFYLLLNKGLACIKRAKSLHDDLETGYIPNMNFNKINEISEETIQRLLKYEEEYLTGK